MTARAILTGDLIGSTDAGRAKVEATMDEIEAAARDISTWCGHRTRFTRFRGDGWQLLLADPGLILWAAVHLYARLAARPDTITTRIGIGIGSVESEGTTDLADGSGTAFVHSGRALDDMSRKEWLFIQGDPGEVRLSDKAICILIDERLRRWSAQQAEAAALYLWPDTPTGPDFAEPDQMTQAGIASRLGITPQAVNYRLQGAGAVALREALIAHRLDMETRPAP